jgi:nucleotide-binding universal stress UspA family protein
LSPLVCVHSQVVAMRPRRRFPMPPESIGAEATLSGDARGLCGWHHPSGGDTSIQRGGVETMSIFPTKILLATDGSEEAELASRTAADLAKSTDSELHILYVWEAANPYVDTVELAGDEPVSQRLDAELRRTFERRAREVLDAETERVRAAGGTVAQAHLRMGKADREVVALAEEVGAGLVVTGSRGHGGIRRALMGSVSDSVVRHAHCPVLVVRR